MKSLPPQQNKEASLALLVQWSSWCSFKGHIKISGSLLNADSALLLFPTIKLGSAIGASYLPQAVPSELV